MNLYTFLSHDVTRKRLDRFRYFFFCNCYYQEKVLMKKNVLKIFFEEIFQKVGFKKVSILDIFSKFASFSDFLVVVLVAVMFDFGYNDNYIILYIAATSLALDCSPTIVCCLTYHTSLTTHVQFFFPNDRYIAYDVLIVT